MFEVWQIISRPCRWNGHEIRVLSCQTGGSRDSCSVSLLDLLRMAMIGQSVMGRILGFALVPDIVDQNWGCL